MRRFYREAIVARDSSACERLLSADFVHNGEARGPRGQRQAVDYFLRAFPDLEHAIELLIAEAWDELDSGAILAQLNSSE